jgi:hypothetical protein
MREKNQYPVGQLLTAFLEGAKTDIILNYIGRKELFDGFNFSYIRVFKSTKANLYYHVFEEKNTRSYFEAFDQLEGRNFLASLVEEKEQHFLNFDLLTENF